MKTRKTKRTWKSGNQYLKDKRDGVGDVLTRAAYDARFRAKLLSKNRLKAKKAFMTAGRFNALPKNFHLKCWERDGADPSVTDNTVHLVLPEYQKLPGGAPQIAVDPDMWWRCTWPAYSTKTRNIIVKKLGWKW